MLIRGENGNELELGFSRESLPEVQDGTGDDGWATVNVRVATADDEWEENAPCLNLFEFVNLAEWLESIAGMRGDEAEIELLQPELKFSVVKASATRGGEGTVTIRVAFQLSERPEEFNVDADTDEADHLDLRIPRDEALVAAAALRENLRQLRINNLKDDILGTRDAGVLGQSDDDLNLIDRVTRDPPGAGDGEDNAGER
ncbi:MAG TPA: hypothetical protein VFF65_09860 [Phycisphaerales bacterium]|nr:hypothetical protein [Phycisphaerales bacterium]